MTSPPPTDLYCLGCGGIVARINRPVALAISCGHCRAYSPILQDDAGHLLMPASLTRGLPFSAPAHLEYYLGYSDHTSPTKQRMIEALVGLGHRSQQSCEETECAALYLRGVAHWEARQRQEQIGEE